MKSRVVALVLLCLCAGVAHAQVNALPPTRHILVYGDAQARAIPDRFKIDIALEVVDPEAEVARSKVEAYVDDILAKLDAASVPANEIVATTLEIEPRERYDRRLDQQVYEGIAVSRKISARFAKLSTLAGFLARLKTSKEVQVSGVTTELSDEPELKRQLRNKAIESTRGKAKVIAKAYGVKLAGLYSVSDVAPAFDYGIQEGDWPSMFRWNGDSTSLDRMQVTGSRLSDADMESFRTGYVTFEDKIYAVFLIEQ